MADKLRIAVLGMAHDHLWGNLKSLAEQEDAELVAGADYNPVLQKRFTEKTGCGKIYDNYEELLDKETPDAVYGFSATALHADQLRSSKRPISLLPSIGPSGPLPGW